MPEAGTSQKANLHRLVINSKTWPHQSLAINNTANNFTGKVKPNTTQPARAGARCYSNERNKTDGEVSKIDFIQFPERTSAGTSSLIQDFWLQLLLLRNNLVLGYCLADWESHETNLHKPRPTHFHLISGSQNSGHVTLPPAEEPPNYELSNSTVRFSTIKRIQEVPESVQGH